MGERTIACGEHVKCHISLCRRLEAEVGIFLFGRLCIFCGFSFFRLFVCEKCKFFSVVFALRFECDSLEKC